MEKLQISLAAARVNAGMTQEDVSKSMKISKNTLVNWEKGLSEPTITQGRKLSEIYNIPLDNIFLPCKSN
ncbi:helix-turn-helix transcriptional regulator [Eshraghiella crossota]|uniref:helix-turn-helix transcriptional regulator n=1 Tax=Eshraghiella crossota TaxID=45851 RepID=UPI003F7FB79A